MKSHNKRHEDRRVFFDSTKEIWEQELEVLKKRRCRLWENKLKQKNTASAKNKISDPRYSTVGLALSGGGIRSALFNLGVLQGFSRLGFLKLVDILSTVSGGGYIGGCLSALLSIKEPYEKMELEGSDVFEFGPNDKPLFSTEWRNFPFRDSPRNPYTPCRDDDSVQSSVWSGRFSGRDEMRHLRNHSNYLLPGGSHFNTMFKSAGALTLHFLAPFLWFTGLIIMATILYMGLLSLAFHFGSISLAVEIKNYNDVFLAIRKLFTDYASGLELPHIIAFTLLSLATLLSSALAYDRIVKKKSSNFYGKLLLLVFSMLFIYFILLFLLFRINFLCLDYSTTFTILYPSVCLVLIFGFIWKLFQEDIPLLESKKFDAEAIDNWLNIVFFGNIIVSSLAIFLRPLVFRFSAPDILLDPAFTAMLNLIILGFLYALFSTLNINKKNPIRIRSLIYMLAGTFFFISVYALIFATVPFLIRGISSITISFLLAVLVPGIKFLANIEQAANEKMSKLTLELSRAKNYILNMAVFLFILFFVVVIGHVIDNAIWEGQWLQETLHQGVATLNFFIFWAIGCALFFGLPAFNFNRLSNHYFYRDGLSEAFLMTAVRNAEDESHKTMPGSLECIVRNLIEMRLSSLHGITSGCKEQDTALGVAAMGPYHIINATLNLTGAHDLLGLRRKTEPFIFSRLFTGSERTGFIRTEKGYPGLTLARAITTSGAAVAPIMGMMTSRIRSFACTIFGMRLGLWLKNPRCLAHKKCLDDKIRYWLGPLLKELTGSVDASQEIYISDGGHSGDNLGIVPLLKRRAKMIIASDAECDKDFLFNSLNSSLRQIFVDEGIKSDMTLGHGLFDANEHGFVKSHFTVGRILYPDRPWQASWMVVLKSSMTGDELTPIVNYKKKSPDFPHETTANQFFTEEQFEAYRALGRHIAYYSLYPCRKINEFFSETPWMATDRLCRALVEILQKIRGEQPSGLCFQHAWDDILQAMWDSEQVDFSSWVAFREHVHKLARDAERSPFRDALVTNLLQLDEWLTENNELYEFLAAYEVPRNLKEFCTLQDELSRKVPVRKKRCLQVRFKGCTEGVSEYLV